MTEPALHYVTFTVNGLIESNCLLLTATARVAATKTSQNKIPLFSIYLKHLNIELQEM